MHLSSCLSITNTTEYAKVWVLQWPRSGYYNGQGLGATMAKVWVLQWPRSGYYNGQGLGTTMARVWVLQWPGSGYYNGQGLGTTMANWCQPDHHRLRVQDRLYNNWVVLTKQACIRTVPHCKTRLSSPVCSCFTQTDCASGW